LNFLNKTCLKINAKGKAFSKKTGKAESNQHTGDYRRGQKKFAELVNLLHQFTPFSASV
jgi:hypothetical protein